MKSTFLFNKYLLLFACFVMAYSVDMRSQEMPSAEQLTQAPIFPGCEKYTDFENQKKCTSNLVNRVVGENFNTKWVPAYFREDFRIRVDLLVDENGDTKVEAISTEPKLNKEIERILKDLPKAVPGKTGDKTVRVRYDLPVIIQAGQPDVYPTDQEYRKLMGIWREVYSGNEITEAQHTEFWKIVKKNGGKPEKIALIGHYKVILNQFRNQSKLFFQKALYQSALESLEKGKKVTNYDYSWYSGFADEEELNFAEKLLDQINTEEGVSIQVIQNQLENNQQLIDKIEHNLEVLFNKKYRS